MEFGSGWAVRVLRLAAVLVSMAVVAWARPASADGLDLYTFVDRNAPVQVGAVRMWKVQINSSALVGSPVSSPGGTLTSYPTQHDLYVPLPEGGRLHVNWIRGEDASLIKIYGDPATSGLFDGIPQIAYVLSWVGDVEGAGGQRAVITYDDPSNISFLFAYIPQACSTAAPCSSSTEGHALRLITRPDGVWLVETVADKWQPHFATDDGIPAITSLKTPPPQQHDDPPATQMLRYIDVSFALTPGFLDASNPSTAIDAKYRLAFTRAFHLVSVANEALIGSGANVRFRAGNTFFYMSDAADDSTSREALFSLTGFDDKGATHAVFAQAYSAHSAGDVTVLFRAFKAAGPGDCGAAWQLGANGRQITLMDWQSGLAVVNDGLDGGYGCGDDALAHELGHLLGLTHDAAHVPLDGSGKPQTGAFPDAYGYTYLKAGTVAPPSGFSTVMGIGPSERVPVAYYSSPASNRCFGLPCGVANQSDAASVIDQTGGTVANFTVGRIEYQQTPLHDVDGDGQSDVLWQIPGKGVYAYWRMDRGKFVSAKSFSTNPTYKVLAAGDLNGDGIADLVWGNSGRVLYAWIGDGKGGYSVHYIGTYQEGWTLVGIADVNGDRKQDLLWSKPGFGQYVYWLMDGAKRLSWNGYTTNAAYNVLGYGDFDSNGAVDIVWGNAARQLYVWWGDGQGHYRVKSIGTYNDGGWKLVGAADVNGNGKPEMLWYSQSLGRLAIWAVSECCGAWSRNSFGTNPAYSVLAVGDFEGVGATDILWGNDARTMYMWGFVGSSVYSRYEGTYSGGGWVPVH